MRETRSGSAAKFLSKFLVTVSTDFSGYQIELNIRGDLPRVTHSSALTAGEESFQRTTGSDRIFAGILPPEEVPRTAHHMFEAIAGDPLAKCRSLFENAN